MSGGVRDNSTTPRIIAAITVPGRLGRPREAVSTTVPVSGGVVGRVSEVHAYTADVELISSPGVRLAAVIEGETQPISYQGGINATKDYANEGDSVTSTPRISNPTASDFSWSPNHGANVCVARPY